MEPSAARFSASIDRACDAARSAVLRYRAAVRLAADARDDAAIKRRLEACSLGEGLRRFPLLEHRGVEIHVLDETSAMATGTLKSIDGCLTAAFCLHEGIERIAFESGGNTGAALTTYGARAGIETYCFVPAENLELLDGAPFEAPTSHLIAVEDPGLVRPAAERFAERHGIARVPRPGWRLAASRFLGCFVLEELLGGREFDVLAQTISAAFGPIGIYDVLASNGVRLPRFLGVQQAANCAMVRAWKAHCAARGAPAAAESRTPALPAPPVRSTEALLARVMYDAEPQRYGTFERLASLLERTGGALITVDHDGFAAALGRHPAGREVIDRLAENGVEITRRGGEVVEKTGLIALVGALAEIDAGRIPRGARVLCCLTSGVVRPGAPAVPDLRVRALADLDSAPLPGLGARAAHA